MPRMFQRCRVVLIALVLATVQVAPAEVITFKKATIGDATSNLPVGTILLPDGWSLSSNILWRLNSGQFVCNTSTVSNGSATVRWLPADQFNCSPTLCANARQQGLPPTSGNMELIDHVTAPGEYIANIVVARYRRENNLRIVGNTDLFQLAQMVKQSKMFDVQQAAQMGYTLKYGAARTRIEYTGNKGPMEEDIYLVLTLGSSEQANANLRQMGMPEEYMILPERVYSLAAPKGQLDRLTPLMQSIVSSVRPTLQWDAYIARLNAIRQQGVIDQGRIAQAAREQANAQQQQTWQARMASEDRIAAGIGDILRNQQRFDDPTSNKEVTLPAGYRRAFSNGQDEYIVSDDLSFNPASTPGLEGNWTEMNQKK